VAIYHLSVKVVHRSRGQSSFVVAARRSGLCLFDERVGLTQRPLSTDLPIYSEIILPHAAPAKWLDRETLWNDVEASGLRRDSLVARKIEVSPPVELPIHLSIELAKNYAVAAFVNIGIVVDLNVWMKHSANSENYPWTWGCGSSGAENALQIDCAPQGSGSRERCCSRSANRP